MTVCKNCGRILVGEMIIAGLIGALPILVNGAPGPSSVDLFRNKGCSGCHSIGGQVGSALDVVGDRYSAESLYKWLNDPAAVKPGTTICG